MQQGEERQASYEVMELPWRAKPRLGCAVLIKDDRGGRIKNRGRERERRMSAGNGLSTVAFLLHGKGRHE